MVTCDCIYCCPVRRAIYILILWPHGALRSLDNNLIILLTCASHHLPIKLQVSTNLTSEAHFKDIEAMS
jgi:hypothetical protein